MVLIFSKGLITQLTLLKGETNDPGKYFKFD